MGVSTWCLLPIVGIGVGLGWSEPLAAKAGFAVGLDPDLLGAEEVAHGLLQFRLLEAKPFGLVLLLEFCRGVVRRVLVLTDVATLCAVPAQHLHEHLFGLGRARGSVEAGCPCFGQEEAVLITQDD